MSASGAPPESHRAPQPHGGAILVVPKGGRSPNPTGMSKHKREMLEAIDSQEVPKVMKVLRKLRRLALAGDVLAARTWLDQVRGPVKARDDDAIATAVQEQLLALIQEARRRRAEQEGSR